MIAAKPDSNKRLDIFLSEKLGITRSQVQKLIGQGCVFVNGKKPSKTGIKLSTGDEVTVSESQPITYSPRHGGASLEPVTCPQILSDTPDYLVINKPSGMVVHATSRETSGTVVDWLLEKYPSVAGVGDDPLRPGIVHRLDKDASGVMVIAKTQDSFDSLKRQFKLRRVTKEYLILVYGNVTPAEGTISIPISRASSHSTRFVGNMKGGRDAVTNYIVDRQFGEFSLVRVMPETGRTHQIRVHFTSRGYPLVGDRVYTSKKITPKSRRSLTDGGRLMLHASALEFRDLSGALQRYECPPGNDFVSVVSSLQK
ncbi:RluA family pseudouridine synthase [Candidatus Uhrbacteria bacterium]|nr:RluA family pseudouridine synthase [Candidatus Uhrbacteria bacterium]